MRIALIQDYLRAGGTERQTVAWARWLAANGHEVVLITFRPGGALEPDDWDPGIGRISLQSTDRRLDWYAPDLVDTLHRADPDCIVCMGRMANSHGWSLARSIREVPLVATFRTGKWMSPFYRWSLKNATGIIVNSRYALERVIREARVPSDRIALVPNPVLLNHSRRPIGMMRQSLREQAGAGDETVVLISCAQFRPEKNQIGLVEMVARLPAEPDWQLWLMGTGKTEKAVRARVQALGLEARIRFPGFQMDPSPWINAADIGVRASRSDSLSNFLIEAQWLGLPVVTTDVGGAGECMVQGESGWITPIDDLEAFGHAVRRLIVDPGLREKAGKAGQVFAHQHFEPEAQFRKQTDFLKRMTGM
ncbi:MAG: glycosyltransferase [Opitutaceae bacterium]